MAHCSKCNKWITIFHTKYVCKKCNKTFCADCINKVKFPNEGTKFLYEQTYDYDSSSMPEYSEDKESYVLCPNCAAVFRKEVQELKTTVDKAANIEVVYKGYNGHKNDYSILIGEVKTWGHGADECREQLKILAAYYNADKLINVETKYNKKDREFCLTGDAVTNPQYSSRTTTKKTRQTQATEIENTKERNTVRPVAVGDNVIVSIEEVSETGRVFCKSEWFDLGIIFPQHIVYKGKPLPIDISESQGLKFAKYIGESVDVKILELRNVNDSRVAILQYECYDGTNSEEDGCFRKLEAGKEYDVKVFDIGENYIQFRFPDVSLRGYIEAGAFEGQSIEIGDKVRVILKNKGYSPFHLMHFMLPTLDNDIRQEIGSGDPKQVESRLNELIPSVGQEALGAEETEFVKSLLKDYPNLPTNKFLDASIHIYCKYTTPDIESKWNRFIKGKENYIGSQNFFIGYNPQCDEIVLFNSDAVVLRIKVNAKGFQLTDIYYDRKDNQVTQILDRNKDKCLKIEGSKIHVLDIYKAVPHDYDSRLVVSHLVKLKELYYSILPKVRKSAYQKRLTEGKDFNTLKDVLLYEQHIEEQKVGSTVEVGSDSHIQRTSCKHYDNGIAFLFELSSANFGLLTTEAEEEDLYVNIVGGDDKPLRSGLLFYDAEKHMGRLEFPSDRGIDTSLMLEGFRIKKKSAVEHLKLQISAIDTFTKSKKDDLFDKIISRQIDSPDITPYLDCDFFDENIKKASEENKENKQPEAVRKALGNKGVLLIQGPPGTGKTTVIVEIVRQLIKDHKKVLVCSQAHAAVENIVNKLKQTDDISFLSINNEGDVGSWGEFFDKEDYRHFLLHNKQLIESLNNGATPEMLEEKIAGFGYKSEKAQKKYADYHRLIVQYYDQNQLGQLFQNVPSILDRLMQDDVALDKKILETYQYQSMDVILGTCIGIGMNRVLKNDSIHFDTVIIDEAAKANLAESLVPISKADRCILVGDHKQLPPYLDTEILKEYIKFKKRTPEHESGVSPQPLKEEEIGLSLSKSLFELLAEGHWLPEENVTMLNFQYRMHPDIGHFISDVFYGGKVQMGKGTHSQYVPLPAPYDRQCIFIETDTNDRREFDKVKEVSVDNSYINRREIEIICDEIIPLIANANTSETISVGILTPYKAQRDELKHRLANTVYKDSVYTIDSIQGMEFDIVIFSFVRSFPKYSLKKVGFLDDMRRLNVSLSRAKKKLILVGNKQTLINENAHRGSNKSDSCRPIDVFRALTKESVSFHNIKRARVFHQKYKVGDIINCNLIRIEGRKVYFHIEGEESLRFSMKSSLPLHLASNFKVEYTENNRANMPQFEIREYTTTSGNVVQVVPCGNAFKGMKKWNRIQVIVASTDRRSGVVVDYKGNVGLIPGNSMTEQYRGSLNEGDQICVRLAFINKDEDQIKFICYPL